MSGGQAVGFLFFFLAAALIFGGVWLYKRMSKEDRRIEAELDDDEKIGEVNAKAQASEAKSGEAGEKNTLINEVNKPWPR